MLLPNTLYDSSGVKEAEGLSLIVTVASVVESFLSPRLREGIAQVQFWIIGSFLY